MVGASKILTVSYGTFSCTLEGFDEPFSTMKAIAEYFRDLAADDRYFGAEPPVPDAEMLHRIAEREIQRRVEAKVQANGVVLRAGQADAADSSMALASPATTSQVAAETANTIPPQSARQAETAMAAPMPVVAAPIADAASALHFEDASDFSLDAIADADLTDELPEDDEDALLDSAADFGTDFAADAPQTLAADHVVDEPDDGVAAKLQRIRAAIKVEKTPVPPIAEVFSDPAPTPIFAETASDAVSPVALPDVAVEGAQNAVPGEISPADEYIEDIDTDDVGEFTGYTDMTDYPAAEDIAADAFVEDGIEGLVEDRIAALREVVSVQAPDEVAAPAAGTVELADNDPLEDSLAAMFNDDSTEFDYVAFDKAAAVGENSEDEVADLAALDGTPEAEAGAEPEELYGDEAADDLADDLDAEEMSALDEGDEFDGDLEGELRALDLEEDEFTQSASSVLEAIRSSKARDEDVADTAEPGIAAMLSDDAATEPAEDLADAYGESDPGAAEQAEPEGDLTRPRKILAEDYGNTPVADMPEVTSPSAEIVSGPIFPDVNEGEDGPISRIFETTKTKLEGAENRRRFSAIAHLKAAVAATVADRKIKATHGDGEESTGVLDRYREDLAEVIRPAAPVEDTEPSAPVAAESHFDAAEAGDSGIEDLRPEEERRRQPIPVMPRRPVPVQAATERPAPAPERVSVRAAPLVLVSEQRVDLSAGQAMAAAPTGPVVIRPRRISAAPLLEQAGDEEDLIEEAADKDLTPEGIAKFGAFVERAGVTSLPDLLEAAAAYTSTVEGHKHFSRPQVMLRAAAVSDDEGFTREAGLRSFGILLRQGKIQKVRRGQFVIASTSRFVNEANATRH